MSAPRDLAAARKPSKAKAHRCANPYAPCRHASHGKPKPKGKTIQAWAVVHPQGGFLKAFRTSKEAWHEVRVRVAWGGTRCVVVPLSGTFTPGRKG